MYCTHCGKSINVNKIEDHSNSITLVSNRKKFDAKVTYVCPRCGHIVHDDLSKEEVKELTRASHAEIQRGSNKFSTGMSFLLVGVIILIISVIFFRLSMKANTGFQLSTNCMEFYAFLVTLVISVGSIVTGIVFVLLGLIKGKHYQLLLKDIQNNTFIQ